MKSQSIAVVLSACLCAAFPCVAAQYSSARVNDKGELQIQAGRHLLPAPKIESEQVGFEQPAVSPDHSTVGWLALYPNCCTSYPLPLALVLYRDGKILRTIIGEGTPIWRWSFVGDGSRIALRQETAHGSRNTHYELREVASGRRIAYYDSADHRSVPKWARIIAD
jgi:hypothetical protein